MNVASQQAPDVRTNKSRELYLILSLLVCITLSVIYGTIAHADPFSSTGINPGFYTNSSGKTSFLDWDGTIKKGVFYYNGNVYYAYPETGEIAKGMVSIDGGVYFFNSDGTRATGTFDYMRVRYYTDGNGRIVGSQPLYPTYYSQKDPAWAYTYVGFSNMYSTGCFPSSAAMALNTQRGTSYNPLSLAREFHYNHYMNYGGAGTSAQAVIYLNNRYDGRFFGITSKGQLAEELRRGNMGVINVGTSKFVRYPATHAMFIGGYSNGSTYVMDPYTPSFNGWYSIDYLWSILSWAPEDWLWGATIFLQGYMPINTTSYAAHFDASDVHVSDVAHQGDKPRVRVQVGNTILTEGQDYTVTYMSNNRVGVFGAGNYIGSAMKSYALASTDVETGTYIVESKLNTNYVFDLAGGADGSGVPIQAWAKNNTPAQEWNIEKYDDGTFTIKSVGSGQYLSVAGMNGTASIATQATPYTFYLIKHGDSYQFASTLDHDLVVDVPSGTLGGGKTLWAYASNSTAAQLWHLQQIESHEKIAAKLAQAHANDVTPGTYSFVTPSTNELLEVPGGFMQGHVKLGTWPYNGTQAQGWVVEKARDGFYRLKNLRSGKYLTHAGHLGLADAFVENSNDELSQLWVLVKGSDNSVAIVSARDDRVRLTPQASKATVISNITQVTWQLKDYVPWDVYITKYASAHKGTLANGTYIFRSFLNTDKVLEVAGGRFNDGAYTNLYEHNYTVAQAWEIKEDVQGLITLKNKRSGLFLHALQSEAGSKVVQSTDSSSYLSKWIAIKTATGISFASAADPTLMVDVSGGVSKDGTQLQLFSSNKTKSQIWAAEVYHTYDEVLAKEASKHAQDLADGLYVLSSKLPDAPVVEVGGGLKNDGANVNIYEHNFTAAQAWQVSHDEKGLVKIVNKNSGAVLTATGSDDGANVVQKRDMVQLTQRWIATKNSDGSYSFRNAANMKLVLDINGGISTNGNNVQVWSQNGTNSQRYVIKPYISWSEYISEKESISQSVAKDMPEEASIYLSARSNFVVEIGGGATWSGARSNIYESNNTAAQKWIVKVDEKGYVSFVNKNSNYALTASSVSATASVVQRPYQSNNMNQKWLLEKTAHGYIIHAATDYKLVIDVQNGAMRNNQGLQLYFSNGSNAQIFNFKNVLEVKAIAKESQPRQAPSPTNQAQVNSSGSEMSKDSKATSSSTETSQKDAKDTDTDAADSEPDSSSK